ncbi:MAG: hypothetical protein ACJAYX_004062 [Planctomycetota bacterium]|jgi:hypothetical protein
MHRSAKMVPPHIANLTTMAPPPGFSVHTTHHQGV